MTPAKTVAVCVHDQAVLPTAFFHHINKVWGAASKLFDKPIFEGERERGIVHLRRTIRPVRHFLALLLTGITSFFPRSTCFYIIWKQPRYGQNGPVFISSAKFLRRGWERFDDFPLSLFNSMRALLFRYWLGHGINY